MPVHHQHKRRRVSWKCEPYPHPNPLVRSLDWLVVVFGFVIAAATVPQAWIIWSNQSAEDVSFIAWAVYLLNAVVYLTYALVHREMPILLGASLLILVNSGVVLGIIIYG